MIGTSLEPIDPSYAKLLLDSHLRGDRPGDELSSGCALIRSCVWALSGVSEPVHVLRVLNLALSVSDCREDEVPRRRERLRAILEELSDAGDLISLSEGRWLPAAAREVILDTDSDARLLVGGLPTSALPKHLREKVTPHGPYRRVADPELGVALKLPKEGVASWSRVPEESLEDWAAHILNVDLEPYREPYDGSRLRIYAPDQAPDGALQIKRWREHPGDVSGRYLAMRERVFGVREFRVVELKRGSVVGSNDCLAPGDARRLMYALDSRARKPVNVVLGSKGDYISVVLRSELPHPEQRLLGALGTLEVPEGAYYPRTWRFAKCYRQTVIKSLTALGVRIVER